MNPEFGQYGEVRAVKKLRAGRILRNVLVLLGILSLAVVACYFLSKIFDDNNPFAVPVFILAVALVARFTSGSSRRAGSPRVPTGRFSVSR